MIKTNENVIIKKEESKRGVKMKVVLPEEKVFNKKQLAIYITIILVCVISIIVAFYVQFYARIDIGRMLGFESENQLGKKTEEQTESLKIKYHLVCLLHILRYKLYFYFDFLKHY